MIQSLRNSSERSCGMLPLTWAVYLSSKILSSSQTLSTLATGNTSHGENRFDLNRALFYSFDIQGWVPTLLQEGTPSDCLVKGKVLLGPHTSSRSSQKISTYWLWIQQIALHRRQYQSTLIIRSFPCKRMFLWCRHCSSFKDILKCGLWSGKYNSSVLTFCPCFQQVILNGWLV